MNRAEATGKLIKEDRVHVLQIGAGVLVAGIAFAVGKRIF